MWLQGDTFNVVQQTRGFQKPLSSGCPKSLILQHWNCQLRGFQKDLRLLKNSISCQNFSVCDAVIRDKQTFRRNAADDGPTNAQRVPLLLFPLGRANSRRSLAAADRSPRRLELCTRPAQALL